MPGSKEVEIQLLQDPRLFPASSSHQVLQPPSQATKLADCVTLVKSKAERTIFKVLLVTHADNIHPPQTQMRPNNEIQLPIVQFDQVRVACHQSRSDRQETFLNHVEVSTEPDARIRSAGKDGTPDEGCCELQGSTFDKDRRKKRMGQEHDGDRVCWKSW